MLKDKDYALSFRKTFISLPAIKGNIFFHCCGSSTTNGAYEGLFKVGFEMWHLTESGVVHVSRSGASCFKKN